MFIIHQIRTYLRDLKENFCRMLFLSLLVLLALPGYGQQQKSKQVQEMPFYQRYRLDAANDFGRIEPAAPFTSLAVSLPALLFYEGAYAIVGGDTLSLKPAAHQPDSAAGVVSELLIFDEPREQVQLVGLLEKAEVWVHFMYAPPLKKNPASGLREEWQEVCEQPVAIQQAEWREGLPEPDYTRSFNEVEHLIVHHSATSNSAANYTQVVRNIYLYHTQTNGWSDIGYNYLIAPDGTLYAGRDPGAAGAQDKVRGAHFCGKNSETMGVCVLGNFMEVAPATAAINKLTDLLSWEVYKEALDPQAIGSHPADPSLPVIAGHRNGCATACPGDYLYALLPEVRQEVAAALQACTDPEDAAPFVSVNFETREICIRNMAKNEMENLQLFTMQGRELGTDAYRLQGASLCWKFEGLSPGAYILMAEGKDQQIRQKILLF
jgi:hypothetical protein